MLSITPTMDTTWVPPTPLPRSAGLIPSSISTPVWLERPGQQSALGIRRCSMVYIARFGSDSESDSNFSPRTIEAGLRVGLFFCDSASSLSSKHRVVAGGAHEEQHWKR